MLYWISVGYATFGLVVCQDIVKVAPPIAKWAVGKNIKTVAEFYLRKGGEIETQTKEGKWVNAY